MTGSKRARWPGDRNTAIAGGDRRWRARRGLELEPGRSGRDDGDNAAGRVEERSAAVTGDDAHIAGDQPEP